MLELRFYFTALKNMRVTVEKQAESFGVSIGTISNWINGKRVPNKTLEEIAEGTERCRSYLRQDDDMFIYALVHNLGLTLRETGMLESEYAETGYRKFLPMLIRRCMDNDEIVSNV